MIYKRDLKKPLKRLLKFPVVAILGPRQSGKTTFVKENFKKHAFFSLEDPTIREFVISDPKGFLRENENSHGIIFDEFQYAPELLSYIQLDVDEKKRSGYFILTGSQNFLMNQAISQSLAGRVGILTLLPLSLSELKKNKLIDDSIHEIILKGMYPRLYAKKIEPQDFYPSYIQTYIERDVRQLINVGNLRTFQKFLELCAGRIGQQLNLSDLASNCGISIPTVHSWLSLLEASYLIFLLRPHFANFNKRITKTPKLFFYDTGIACSLLGISTTKTLALSPFRGNLFENFIISDLCKQFFNNGQRPPLYFWRDANGRIEVDCIIDIENKLIPVEIKASETIASNNFFKSLEEWNALSQTSPAFNYVVYGGEDNQTRNKGHIIGWKSESDLVEKVYKRIANE